MSLFSIKIIGDKEISRKLKELSRKDRKKAIRIGSRKGAKVVQKKAKKNVPKDTGELRKSIKVRSLKRSRRWTGAKVVSALRHTWPVEQGVPERNVPGVKYMARAMDEERDKATEVFRNEILNEIKKIWES
jgi:HK97 gp10 family phage protein